MLRRHWMDPGDVVRDEDEADLPPVSIEEIRAGLERSAADQAARRTVPGERVVAELRAMIAEHESKRRQDEADRLSR